MEITYLDFELHEGKCSSCGDVSDEILIDDGRCVECVEADRFYESTMRDL
jgi:hypothetical protein